MPLEPKEIHMRINAFNSYAKDWDETVEEAFDMYALRQWPEADRKRLEGQKRPALVVDRIRPTVDAVAGIEAVERYEPTFVPRNQEFASLDPQAADAIKELYRWIRQQAYMASEESSAFHSCVVCGVGCTDTFLDETLMPEGQIVTRNVPVWEVGWDPESTQQNFLDRTFVFREKWIQEKIFQEMFGFSSDEMLAVRSNPLERGEERDAEGGYQLSRIMYRAPGKISYSPYTKQVRVVDFQYEERRNKVQVSVPVIPPELMEVFGPVFEAFPEAAENQGGEVILLRDDGKRLIDALQLAISASVEIAPEIEIPPLSYGSTFTSDYYQVLMAGDMILERRKLPGPYSIKFVTAFEDFQREKGRYYFGLVRSMTGAQQFANRFISLLIHRMAVSPKGAMLVEKGVFPEFAKARDDWASPEALVEVEDGSLSMTPRPKFERFDTPPGLTGMDPLIQFLLDSIPMSSGVNYSYTAGQADNLSRTPYSSIRAVQQRNMIAVSKPFSSLRRYRQEHAAYALQLAREVFPDDQILRVLGPRGPQIIELTRDRMIQDYDVVIEESPTTPNRQEEVFERLVQTGLINKILEQGLTVPELWDFIGFPPDVTEALRKAQEQGIIGEIQERLLQAGLPEQLVETVIAALQQPQQGEGAEEAPAEEVQ